MSASKFGMESLNSLSYRSYFLDRGWCDWTEAGKMIDLSGITTGMTCFELKYTGKGTILMQSYIQNEGWSREVHNDEVCGDPTQANKIQAIRIQLLESKGYHLFYRVRLDNDEWSVWKRDYEVAGTLYGNNYIVTFEIRLVMEEPHVQYRAYIKDVGWSSMVGDNHIVGFEGKGLRMEALWIHYDGPGRIVLQGLVEHQGWLPEVECDSICGTVAKGLRLEAIRIRLLDLDEYHVYYCSYIKGMGWQPWVKDWEVSGTEGESLPIEAVRIRIAS